MGRWSYCSRRRGEASLRRKCRLRPFSPYCRCSACSEAIGASPARPGHAGEPARSSMLEKTGPRGHERLDGRGSERVVQLTKDWHTVVPHVVPAPRAPVKRVVTTRSTSLAPRVVILGGGFAGVSTAHELARRCAGVLPVHITLISDQNFYLFTPLLAEATTGAVEAHHVIYPIRPLLCAKLGVEFGEMTVEAIDLDRRRVTACHRRSPGHQEIPYDMLVLALGVAPDTTTAPGVEEYALGFKAVGDAYRVRNHVIDQFEAAALTDDSMERRRPLTFVVVGAGPPPLRGGRRGPRRNGTGGRSRGADAGDPAPPLFRDPAKCRASRPGEQCGAAANGHATRGDRKSTRLNSSHVSESRMPSSG